MSAAGDNDGRREKTSTTAMLSKTSNTIQLQGCKKSVKESEVTAWVESLIGSDRTLREEGQLKVGSVRVQTFNRTSTVHIQVVSSGAASAAAGSANKNYIRSLWKLIHAQPLKAWTKKNKKVMVPAANSKENNSGNSKDDDWRRALILGRDFHRYLHENGLVDKASDRNAAGSIFGDFFRAQQRQRNENDDDDDEDPDEHDEPPNINNNQPTRRLESFVMARMRELRLMRSRRVGENQVVLHFCNLDGTFPSREERAGAVRALHDARERERADKHGVAVSEMPLPQESVAVGETRTIAFEVRYIESEGAVKLQRVVLDGPHRNSYQLKRVKEGSVLSPGRALTLELSLTPRRIGIFRAVVACYLVTESSGGEFVISRFVTLKSTGDKEMDKILQPTAPYERVKPKAYRKKPVEIFEPPKLQISGNQENPFGKLPQYPIPRELQATIVSDEFRNFMEDIKWPPNSGAGSGVAGYGRFWKNLLWAQEHQNHMDIQVFDMQGATLERHGHFLKLKVLGLAEGRPSVLRGDVVTCTWKRKLYKGRVRETQLLYVILEFHSSFHRRYNPSLDRVDVRFTFSRMTIRTSHAGCVAAEIKLGEAMLAPTLEHVDAIHSKSNNSRSSAGSLNWNKRDLNEEQKRAVQSIVAGSSRLMPYVIFGPPGTGKTTTVVEAVYQLVKDKKLKVLLVAPSNDAADLLTERLASSFPPSELRRILAYSRPISSVSPTIREYCNEFSSPEAQLSEITSARTKIVVCTVDYAARLSYYGVPRSCFDVLCVDEVGHATEPEVVSVAASLFDFAASGNSARGQVILAGDPKQLGPIITSPLCNALGLNVSYLERLMGREAYGRREQDGQYPAELLTKLVRNYRSHPKIIKLPNEMFYDSELQCCGDKISTHSYAKWEHLPNKGFPVLFHSMDGENLREGNSPSWFNLQEAQQAVVYAKLLTKSRPPINEEDIGIITPYARQAQKIRLALKSQNLNNIKVGSVECFQGQERRCIIISTVRSEPEQVSSDLKYNLGFVANEKRFNVAITRAKALLIVVGCAKVLAMDEKNWLPFLKFCNENKSWVGEEWDPFAASLKNTSNATPSTNDDSDWQIIGGPSKAAEEEAAAFISREE